MKTLLELAERYNIRAPRYTSYPAATAFHEGIGETDLAAAIRRSNDDPLPAPVSLYLHLPFCRSLCYYCACNRTITRPSDRTARYLDLLPEEARRVAPLLAEDRVVNHIHLGGGTPTYFPVAELRALLDELGLLFRFAPHADSDWSIEVDPRTVEPADILGLRETGFTRLSFGVQDLTPQVQKAINRELRPAALAELMAAARDAGFRSVNFDLIYGLPYQDVDNFTRTLEQVEAFSPDRIALYAYAHLPERFRAQRLLESESLPRGSAKLALLVRAIERLRGAGYEYIGMDHFARPEDALSVSRRNGTLVRNFQGYMPGPDTDLIALGSSAISFIGGAYIQNTRTVAKWETLLRNGRHPAERGYVLDADDRIRRDVIAAIMCTDEVAFADIENRYDVVFRQYFGQALERLAPLEDDGLIELGAERIRILPLGRLFLRAIAMAFDAHLPQAVGNSATQHYSRVV